MRQGLLIGILTGAAIVSAAIGLSQEAPAPAQNPPTQAAQTPNTPAQNGQSRNAPAPNAHKPQAPVSFMNMTPEQRAAATRSFLGLGAPPDSAAVARGTPLYQRTCSFCHGPRARGAEGPNLVTSDIVLTDEQGRQLVPFLKAGRPAKGMPSFAGMTDDQLRDIAAFLHQQVEDVANRGAYELLNIVVGNPARGQAYVTAHCMQCHTAATFAHIAGKYRTPDRLQRGWIWPDRFGDPSVAITAVVTTPDGGRIEGRVTRISDFRIALVDHSGQTHVIDRGPGVDVALNDPLAPHQAMIMHLSNDDMHDVTAYLETQK